MRRGLVGGLKGFAGGVLGVAVKPVAGAIDGAVLSLQGIANTIAEHKDAAARDRLPRYVGLDGVLTPYSARDAQGGARLHLLMGQGVALGQELVFSLEVAAYRTFDVSASADERQARVRQLQGAYVLWTETDAGAGVGAGAGTGAAGAAAAAGAGAGAWGARGGRARGVFGHADGRQHDAHGTLYAALDSHGSSLPAMPAAGAGATGDVRRTAASARPVGAAGAGKATGETYAGAWAAAAAGASDRTAVQIVGSVDPASCTGRTVQCIEATGLEQGPGSSVAGSGPSARSHPQALLLADGAGGDVSSDGVYGGGSGGGSGGPGTGRGTHRGGSAGAPKYAYDPALGCLPAVMVRLAHPPELLRAGGVQPPAVDWSDAEAGGDDAASVASGTGLGGALSAGGGGGGPFAPPAVSAALLAASLQLQHRTAQALPSPYSLVVTDARLFLLNAKTNAVVLELPLYELAEVPLATVPGSGIAAPAVGVPAAAALAPGSVAVTTVTGDRALVSPLSPAAASSAPGDRRSGKARSTRYPVAEIGSVVVGAAATVATAATSVASAAANVATSAAVTAASSVADAASSVAAVGLYAVRGLTDLLVADAARRPHRRTVRVPLLAMRADGPVLVVTCESTRQGVAVLCSGAEEAVALRRALSMAMHGQQGRSRQQGHEATASTRALLEARAAHERAVRDAAATVLAARREWLARSTRLRRVAGARVLALAAVPEPIVGTGAAPLQLVERADRVLLSVAPASSAAAVAGTAPSSQPSSALSSGGLRGGLLPCADALPALARAYFSLLSPAVASSYLYMRSVGPQGASTAAQVSAAAAAAAAAAASASSGGPGAGAGAAHNSSLLSAAPGLFMPSEAGGRPTLTHLHGGSAGAVAVLPTPAAFLQVSYAILLSLQPSAYVRTALLHRLGAVAAEQAQAHARAQAQALEAGAAARWPAHPHPTAATAARRAPLPFVTVGADGLSILTNFVIHRTYADFAELWGAVPAAWSTVRPRASAGGATAMRGGTDEEAIFVPPLPDKSRRRGLRGSTASVGGGAAAGGGGVFSFGRRTSTAPTLPPSVLKHIPQEYRAAIASLQPLGSAAPPFSAGGSTGGGGVEASPNAFGAAGTAASAAGDASAAASVPTWASLDAQNGGSSAMLQALNRCLLGLLEAVQREEVAQAAAARAQAQRLSRAVAPRSLLLHGARGPGDSRGAVDEGCSVTPEAFAAVSAALQRFLFGNTPPSSM
jgi:hypothetical protein